MLDTVKRTDLNSTTSRETCRMHEIFVDFPGALTTLLDAPNDERLTTTTIAGCKHTFNTGSITIFWRLNVGPGVSFKPKALCAIIRTQKSHAQKHKIRWEKFLRARDVGLSPLTFSILVPFDTNSLSLEFFVC